jgi:hypothetical protein
MVMQAVPKNLFIFALFIGVMFLASANAFSQEITSAKPDKIELRAVPDTTAEHIKAQREFGYANDSSLWKRESTAENKNVVRLFDALSKSIFLRWLLYLFLGAIILYAIYQVMVVNNFFIFSRSRKNTTNTGSAEQQFFDDDLDSKIQHAIAIREYRKAVRWMFLKTLRILHSHQLIQLNAKSTNLDYIKQLQKKQQAAGFTHLVHIYEHVWYGEYQLTEHQFQVVLDNFNRFIEEH